MDDKAKAQEFLTLFGRKIALERERHGLSQLQLAEQSDINLALLIDIEQGVTDFPIEDMFSLFEILNIDVKEFFTDFT